ncbi:hypothetical protein [Actinoallomurus rhizosphaericola]|uniref:hypothetical protein n=1 Tax=Actinoallomurus rhizosphaericola TaxID=2952536 RepID=UPI0020936FCF|nr:hypothetical protein [Actinoallomurus rhizosphaericola]MCO5996787.1 hypothetical protein [Actinoallomurus rhizosphaericola]
MRPSMHRLGLIRAADAAPYLRGFVLSGIATVLVTRALLAQTGYPKVGGGNLHIAHALWGGLLMAVGLGIAVAFLGRAARLWAAIVGGVGFGLFIDEIGKLVNKTGYFYRPAAGLIYLTFAGLVLVSQWAGARAPLSPRERTANAASTALAGLSPGLTPQERRAAVRLIADLDGEVPAALLRLLDAVPERRPYVPGPVCTAAARVRGLAGRLARHRVVRDIAVCYPAAQGALTLAGVLADDVITAHPAERQTLAVVAVACCAVVSAALGGYGVLRLARDRPAAFRLCNAALLVDILAGQVFKFTINQFAALSGLAVDLLVAWIIATELRGLTAPRPSVTDLGVRARG